ncbi:hypothetical protein LSAT2_027823 [Lamellibrachia satsuma]|nr:hypothetical protein LSAT2_027823 [Lamellibrachia satsuma]
MQGLPTLLRTTEDSRTWRGLWKWHLYNLPGQRMNEGEGHELRKREAKRAGRKKELIERLEAYDRNSNVG